MGVFTQEFSMFDEESVMEVARQTAALEEESARPSRYGRSGLRAGAMRKLKQITTTHVNGVSDFWINNPVRVEEEAYEQ
jgi:hypothetical protein